jgi:hypothetical protein
MIDAFIFLLKVNINIKRITTRDCKTFRVELIPSVYNERNL